MNPLTSYITTKNQALRAQRIGNLLRYAGGAVIGLLVWAIVCFRAFEPTCQLCW